MNKKIVIHIISIVITVFLVAEVALAEQDSNNAATYYNKAFELLNYSYKDPVHKKVIDVVENGWLNEHKELEEILKQNAPAIAEFGKGISFKKCDFVFGKVYDNPYLQPLPNLSKARDLSSLVLLRGRWYESKNNYGEAIKQYLFLLTLAQHISQSKILVSIMMATAIENMALRAIQQYLEQKEINSQACKNILVFLQSIAFKRSTLAEGMEKEKEAYLWSGRYTGIGIRDKIAQNKTETKEISLVELLSESFKDHADKYYNPIIKFAQTNSETDRQYIDKEIESLSKNSESLNKWTEMISLIITDPTKRNREIADMFAELSVAIAISSIVRAAETYYFTDPTKRNREIADMFAELSVAIAIPSIVRAAETYYFTEAKFRILEVAAAIRVYAAEKNKLPDTLSELVPDYLDSIPTDPWSQKPLKYVKTEERLLVYSFGPDRTDNNGAGTGYEKIIELEGKDIVFSANMD